MRYLIASVLFVLAGCGLQQNPLAGRDARLEDGVATPTKPIYDKPIDSQSVRIGAPDFATLDEGKPFEMSLSSRVLVPDYVATVKVENLAEFPGALFDGATGKFVWTPPKGFVASVGASGAIERTVVVRATALKPDAPILFAVREVRLRIAADFTGPVINAIYKDSNVLREGDSLNVTIRVEDPDANDADPNSWPDIVFDNASSVRSLAPWMELRTRTRWDTHVYNYYYRINLENADLTRSVSETVTGFFALSKQNRRSTGAQVGLTVYNQFPDPATTWTRTLAFRAGERKTYTFLIFDPRGDMMLGYQSVRDLPSGATLGCINVNGRSTLECTLEWTPATGDAGVQYAILLAVNVRNPDTRDTQTAYRNLYLSYRVDPQGGNP